ncbi:MAG: O-antigen ligase family protein [Elusimicrobia bacterium]|nr:O-antigen ligase family protein [Elusimicrobiota bacterium]
MSALLGAAVSIFAFSLPLSIAAMNVSAGLLSALWFFSRKRRGAPPWWSSIHPASYSLALYLCAGLVACLFGIDPDNSFKSVSKEFHKLWMLLLLPLALRGCRWQPVLFFLGLGFSAAAVIGIHQALFVKSDFVWTRAHAFVHPVTYGEQMAVACLGAFCLMSSRSLPKSWRRIAAGLLLLLGTALWFSQTRGAFLGLGAGLFAIGLMDRRLRRWAFAGLLVALLLWLGWELLGKERSFFTAYKQYGFELGNQQLHRLVFWKVALNAFLDHPWTGVGPGNYPAVFPRYFQGTLQGQSVWGSAHNLFLHQAAERGLLGLAALVGVLTSLTLSSWRAALSRRPLALWAFGALSAFLVMNLSEVAWQTEQVATLIIFVWALGQNDKA